MASRSRIWSIAFVLAAWAFDTAPAVAEGAKPAAKDEKARADETLRDKGLRRKGPVYVLAEEDEVARQASALQMAFGEWNAMLARRNLLVQGVAEGQTLLAGVAGRRQQLLANALAAAGAGVNPPGAFPQGNDPARQGAQGRGPQDAAFPQAGAQAIQNEILGLEAQMMQVQSKIVEAEFAIQSLDFMTAMSRSDLEQRRTTLVRLADQVARRYKELSSDTQVREALRTLNKDSALRFALGPVEDYKANLARMAADLLKGKGVQASRKRPGLVLEADTDVRTLEFLAEKFQHELTQALGKQQAESHAEEFRAKTILEAVAHEKALTEELGRERSDEARERVAGSLKAARARLEKLRAEALEQEAARKKLADQVAIKREAFVQSVAALRKALDRSQQKHEELGQDDEVKRALGDLQAGRKKGAIRPLSGARRGRVDLEELEAMIRSEAIALDPDKVLLWVDATLNGKPAQKMVVDPGVDSVRLSARTAALLGVEPAGDAPAVDVALPGGRSLPARRATLRSVQVGGFTVEDVACLVFLEGYEAPPLLGASFLAQFSIRLDPEAARLTLTRVDVRSLLSRHPARAPSPARKEKKRPAGKDNS